MHIDRLNYLIEVAKTESLTVAARNLFVTQSALSQAIRGIEKELGVEIFLRTRQGLQITYEGKKIVEKANEVLSKYQELKKTADMFRLELEGELRIATIAGLMSSLMGSLSDFKKKHPKVEFLLSEKGSIDIVNDVEQGKYDIGLVYLNDEVMKNNKDFIFESLLEGRILASVGVDSHLANNNQITLEQLKKEKLVLYNDESILQFVKKIEQKLGPLNILFVSDNGEVVRRAVADELGMTVAVDFTLRNSPNIKRGLAITLPITDYEQKTLSFGWVYSKSNKNSVIINKFITTIKEEISRSNKDFATGIVQQKPSTTE